MPEKTDKERVAAGAGLVSLGRMLGSLFNLLTVMTLTRFLDKPVFAIVAFFFLLQETLATFGSLGLPHALVYFVPRLGPASARALGLWTGVTLFALAVPISLVVWFGGGALAELLARPDFATGWSYLAVFVLADFPGRALPHALLGQQHFGAWFGVTVVFYGSRFAALAVPAALGAPLESILLWFCVVAYGRLGVYIAYIALFQRGTLRRVGFRVRSLLAYGAPLCAASGVHHLNTELDKYMIAMLCTAEVFAVYNVGAIELPIVSGIAGSVTLALLPTLVMKYEQRDFGTLVAYWHGAVAKIAAIMMPLFFFCFLLAESLMRLLYSGAYSMAAVPFRVYLLLLPLRLCAYGDVVRATGRTRPLLTEVVLSLLVGAGLNYPLYLLLGVPGPAVATVCGQLVGILWLLHVLRGSLELTWRGLLPFATIAKTAAVAALAAVPLVPLMLTFENDGLRMGLGAPIYLAAYLPLGRVSGVIRARDLTYLRDLLSLRFLRK